MSKTAQRKRSAYSFAFNVGRNGWPAGVACYKLGCSAARRSWDEGLAAGKVSVKRSAVRDYRAQAFWLSFALTVCIVGALA